MNLADIRKKAEASRKSAATAPEEVGIDATLSPEIDIYERQALEPPSLQRLEMAGDNNPEQISIPAGQTLENGSFEPDVCIQAICPVESLSEPLPIDEPETGASEESQSPVLLPTAISRRLTEYNPLETILSGRASAVDGEDNAQLHPFSYSSEDIEEYLCFRVADEEYAISIMSIKEIIKPREVTEVPRMPSFISGVISLRGVIIPVMDMRLRLSLPVTAAAGRERIVVLKRDAGLCGVLVDEVVQVARIKKVDIEEPPAVLEGIDRDFVTGLGHFDNRMLILLSLETILDITVH